MHNDKKYAQALERCEKPGIFCLNQNQNGKLLTGLPQIYSALILTLVITMRQKKGGEMTLQTKVRTISLNDKNPRYCVGFAMRKPFEQMV
ncbi:hypothetical protein [Klebsiella aerogenes]|uniref:hypothetical protein n=1 Tax=Klebsiella aerogenes TaxID=548 RepID=UPI00063CE5F6|nr:hypothetical protein [Klebsiella aerogenes]KLF68755.1 hypothetical protein YA38_17155 [Klebsiella aerogenes]